MAGCFLAWASTVESGCRKQERQTRDEAPSWPRKRLRARGRLEEKAMEGPKEYRAPFLPKLGAGRGGGQAANFDAKAAAITSHSAIQGPKKRPCEKGGVSGARWGGAMATWAGPAMAMVTEPLYYLNGSLCQRLGCMKGAQGHTNKYTQITGVPTSSYIFLVFAFPPPLPMSSHILLEIDD
eukprot:928646-Pyramimonas_sp.AAC.1